MGSWQERKSTAGERGLRLHVDFWGLQMHYAISKAESKVPAMPEAGGNRSRLCKHCSTHRAEHCFVHHPLAQHCCPHSLLNKHCCSHHPPALYRCMVVAAPCSAAGSSCITAGTVRLLRGATATLQGDSSSLSKPKEAVCSNHTPF